MTFGTAGRPTSVWMDTAPTTTYPPLDPAASVDVCVIGAGITGITAALLLKEAGVTVALVESDRIAAGVTGYTTAKISALHGLAYDQVRSSFGRDGARTYAEANLWGLEYIARQVRERSIDCAFRRRPAFTYTEAAGERGTIEQEVEAARDAGLDATFAEQVDLPWPVAGAIRLEHQAEFHPRRYLLALAAAIPGEGSHVFERTRATGVHDGDPCRVETDQGQLTAREVLVTTHYPIFDRGLFFARLAAERSYAVALRTRGPIPEGMFLSSESPSHSVRAHPLDDGSELLIVGGESHKTGQGGDTAERVARLEAWARDRFDVDSVEYRWSTQDCMPADGIPYVGRFSPTSRHLSVATGYKKWGMTNGTMAASILADAVVGRDNPWAGLFDANRFKPKAAATTLLKENVNVAAHFFGDRLASPDARSVAELAPGEGGIVASGGERVAAYRDPAGRVHAVSALCTHLYCRVKWNSAETSWDCPCHGSRFDVDGTVLEGPAVKALERKELPGAATEPTARA